MQSDDIEYYKWTGDTVENGVEVSPQWIQDAFNSDLLFFDSVGYGPPSELFLNVGDAENGARLIELDDYIVRRVSDGCLVPVSGELFELLIKLGE